MALPLSTSCHHQTTKEKFKTQGPNTTTGPCGPPALHLHKDSPLLLLHHISQEDAASRGEPDLDSLGASILGPLHEGSDDLRPILGTPDFAVALILQCFTEASSCFVPEPHLPAHHDGTVMVLFKQFLAELKLLLTTMSVCIYLYTHICMHLRI